MINFQELDPQITSKNDGRGRGVVASQELTSQEERFASEYLLDLNGTQAMLRTAPRLKKDSAAVQACRLLRRAKVAKRIKQLMAERAARVDATSDAVLARLWSIATADVRELMSIRLSPCRRCWESESIAAKKLDGDIYSGKVSRIQPDPSCATCAGSGVPRVVLADTASLSEPARLLIAGVRRTPSGAEYEIHDQLNALRLVGYHMGLWGRDLPAFHDAPDSVSQLLQELGAKTPASEQPRTEVQRDSTLQPANRS